MTPASDPVEASNRQSSVVARGGHDVAAGRDQMDVTAGERARRAAADIAAIEAGGGRYPDLVSRGIGREGAHLDRGLRQRTIAGDESAAAPRCPGPPPPGWSRGHPRADRRHAGCPRVRARRCRDRWSLEIVRRREAGRPRGAAAAGGVKRAQRPSGRPRSSRTTTALSSIANRRERPAATSAIRARATSGQTTIASTKAAAGKRRGKDMCVPVGRSVVVGRTSGATAVPRVRARFTARPRARTSLAGTRHASIRTAGRARP